MKENKIFDEWLVLRIQSGDKKAIPILVEKWHDKIVIYINRIVNDKETSRDIAQDCWIAILKGVNRLRKKDKLGSWILSIAHRKAIDHLRTKSKSLSEYEKSMEYSFTPESNPSQSNFDKMKFAMEKLSPIHKNVLKLFYLEGFTLDEISSITNKSKGTIKSQLFYARNHLKKILKL